MNQPFKSMRQYLNYQQCIKGINQMETEMIDKLFLELSQVTSARTKTELALIGNTALIRDLFLTLSFKVTNDRYSITNDKHLIDEIATLIENSLAYCKQHTT